MVEERGIAAQVLRKAIQDACHLVVPVKKVASVGKHSRYVARYSASDVSPTVVEAYQARLWLTSQVYDYVINSVANERNMPFLSFQDCCLILDMDLSEKLNKLLPMLRATLDAELTLDINAIAKHKTIVDNLYNINIDI